VNAHVKVTAVILLLSLAAGPAMAQDRADREKRVRRAARQMWLGSGMMATGAFLLPITAATGSRDDANGLVGIGVIAVGSVVLWSGAQNRRKALRPSTTVSLQLGRTTAVQLQRVW
jgi:hypothetical protein